MPWRGQTLWVQRQYNKKGSRFSYRKVVIPILLDENSSGIVREWHYGAGDEAASQAAKDQEKANIT